MTNENIYDLSDGVFTISTPVIPTITVTYPNGGESLLAGTLQNITWVSSNVINIKIEYTINNGGSWIEIISSASAAVGSYSWSVPNTLASQCRVRLSDAINLSINDISNNVFTISEAAIIILITPNGGEQLQVGTSQIITWSDNISENIKIELYKDGEFNSTITASTISSGYYGWTIPPNQTTGTDYKIRITSLDRDTISDFSDNNFSIVPIPFITISEPNGGESWQAGTAQSIIWKDNISENVRIDLYKGEIFNSTIITSTPSEGSYNWTMLSNQLPDIDYKIKISSVNNDNLFDFSDSNFSVGLMPSITINTPSGNENWNAGTIQYN